MDQQPMRKAGWRTAGIFAGAVLASPALAAGGGHVVDDAAVETPGVCHLESWSTLTSGRSGLANASLACTRAQWPALEIGGFATRNWAPGPDQGLAGLASKLVLRSEESGIGIGLAASFGVAAHRGRFETAGAIIPVTLPLSDHVRLNINAGWQWARRDRDHQFVGGAQIEVSLPAHLALMAEGFGHDRGKVGGQVGLRWTPADGPIDLDLIAGHAVDGTARRALTLGITVRR